MIAYLSQYEELHWALDERQQDRLLEGGPGLFEGNRVTNPEASMSDPAGARSPWTIAPYFLVDDVVATAEFYRDKLGFAYDRFWGDPPAFCMVARRGVIIMLSQIETAGAARPNRVADPERRLRRARASTLEIPLTSPAQIRLPFRETRFPMPTSHRRAATFAAGLIVALAGCRDAAEPDALDQAHTLAEATAAPPFAQISAGSSHSCGVTRDDRAYCWGENNFGMLGDGTGQRRLAPVAVLGGLRFVQVSAGTTHTCGLTTDGHAWCWGQNDLGQLGDGTAPTGHPTPVAVAGTRRFTQLRVGFRHTCALTAAGAAFCWGENGFGQLGNGSSTGPDNCSGVPCSIRPIRAARTRVFRQIKPGGEHTCGLAEDRRVWCWGNNVFGQLGDGTLTTRLNPVAVAGNRQFGQLSAGGMHTCGVDRSSRAWCWGRNETGQVGDGSTVTRRRRPVKVSGEFAFQGVSAGVEHTCATTTSDVVRCWGRNTFGQLGDGTTTNRSVPTRVAGWLRWRMVSAGWMASCAITLGDRAYCWGTNTGDGTNTLRTAPTPVAPPS